MTDQLSILKIIEDTIVDGPGFRISVYAAGCAHHCIGCHNPQSWDILSGQLVPTDDLFQRIINSSSDVTFSGGDPLYQIDGFTQLARMIKSNSSKSIWCYTGFLFEDICRSERLRKILPYIDVLIDGPFRLQERDTSLLFRGSRNQRMIDVAKSIDTNRVVLFDYDPFPNFN